MLRNSPGMVLSSAWRDASIFCIDWFVGDQYRSWPTFEKISIIASVPDMCEVFWWPWLDLVGRRIKDFGWQCGIINHFELATWPAESCGLFGAGFTIMWLFHNPSCASSRDSIESTSLSLMPNKRLPHSSCHLGHHSLILIMRFSKWMVSTWPGSHIHDTTLNIYRCVEAQIFLSSEVREMFWKFHLVEMVCVIQTIGICHQQMTIAKSRPGLRLHGKDLWLTQRDHIRERYW